MQSITDMMNAAVATANYARKPAAGQGELRWITLHGGEDGGGTHVQVNGSGDIVKGPSGLAAKGIKNVGDFGKSGTKADRPKPEPKATPSEPDGGDQSASDEPEPAAEEPAKAKASSMFSGFDEITATEVNAPGISANDIPYDVAYNAHRNSSFVPERRAKQRQNEYVQQMNEDWAYISGLADTPELQEQAEAEFKRYAEGYRQKKLSVLHAASRTASAMITGPANFPTRSNQKRMNTEHRRWEELTEFRKKALSAIQRKIAPEESRMIRSGDPQAVELLKKKLEQAENDQAEFKKVNAAHKAFLKNPKSLDASDLSDKLKEAIRNYKPMYSWEPHPIAPYTSTNNAANIRRIKERIEQVSKMKAGSHTEVTYSGDVRVTEDPDAARIRIHFPGKPERETIAKLKSGGFRWSPSEGAWQRHLNNAGRYAVSSVLEKLGHEKIGVSTPKDADEVESESIPEPVVMHSEDDDEPEDTPSKYSLTSLLDAAVSRYSRPNQPATLTQMIDRAVFGRMNYAKNPDSPPTRRKPNAPTQSPTNPVVESEQSSKPSRQPGDGSAGWQKVGGASVFVDEDGKIEMGCPGLRDEHVSDLIGESDESRDVRDARQAHAEAAGIDGKAFTKAHKRKFETAKAQEMHKNAKSAAKSAQEQGHRGVSTKGVLQSMPDIHAAAKQQHGEREAARKTARDAFGQNASTLNRSKGDRDLKSGLDEIAPEIFHQIQEHLGHSEMANSGRGGMGQVTADDSQAIELINNFIAEGVQHLPGMHSIENAEQAAAMLSAASRSKRVFGDSQSDQHQQQQSDDWDDGFGPRDDGFGDAVEQPEDHGFNGDGAGGDDSEDDEDFDASELADVGDADDSEGDFDTSFGFGGGDDAGDDDLAELEADEPQASAPETPAGRFATEDDSEFAKRQMFEEQDDSSISNVERRRAYFAGLAQNIRRREADGDWDSDAQRKHNMQRLAGHERERDDLASIGKGLLAKFDAEYEALGELQDSGEAMSIDALADKFDVLPHHLDAALRGLVASGDIEKLDDETYRAAPIEPDDAQPAPAKPTEQSKPAVPTFKVPNVGVAGSQMGMFGQTSSGQKQLFNVAKPSKQQGQHKPQASLLEQIGDDMSKAAKANAALPGQIDMFGKSKNSRNAMATANYSYQSANQIAGMIDAAVSRHLATATEHYAKRKSAKGQGELHWITIHPNGPGSEGRAIEIDGKGNITKGFGTGGNLNDFGKKKDISSTSVDAESKKDDIGSTNAKARDVGSVGAEHPNSVKGSQAMSEQTTSPAVAEQSHSDEGRALPKLLREADGTISRRDMTIAKRKDHWKRGSVGMIDGQLLKIARIESVPGHKEERKYFFEPATDDEYNHRKAQVRLHAGRVGQAVHSNGTWFHVKSITTVDRREDSGFGTVVGTNHYANGNYVTESEADKINESFQRKFEKSPVGRRERILEIASRVKHSDHHSYDMPSTKDMTKINGYGNSGMAGSSSMYSDGMKIVMRESTYDDPMNVWILDDPALAQELLKAHEEQK